MYLLRFQRSLSSRYVQSTVALVLYLDQPANLSCKQIIIYFMAGLAYDAGAFFIFLLFVYGTFMLVRLPPDPSAVSLAPS